MDSGLLSIRIYWSKEIFVIEPVLKTNPWTNKNKI